MNKKAERAARQHQLNSQRLINTVRQGFKRGANQHLVFCIRPEDFDWEVLEHCNYPMSDVSNEGALARTIAFKRDRNTPDLDDYRGPAPIWHAR